MTCLNVNGNQTLVTGDYYLWFLRHCLNALLNETALFPIARILGYATDLKRLLTSLTEFDIYLWRIGQEFAHLLA